MKKPGPRSIAVDKRLALRMVFLLVAALLGGLLFVFHVRDMENQRLRRDLQGLAESLAIMLGPEQIHHLQDQPAGAARTEVSSDSRSVPHRQIHSPRPLPPLDPGASGHASSLFAELGR